VVHNRCIVLAASYRVMQCSTVQDTTVRRTLTRVDNALLHGGV
jgi:hypothetical protein